MKRSSLKGYSKHQKGSNKVFLVVCFCGFEGWLVGVFWLVVCWGRGLVVFVIGVFLFVFMCLSESVLF